MGPETEGTASALAAIERGLTIGLPGADANRVVFELDATGAGVLVASGAAVVLAVGVFAAVRLMDWRTEWRSRQRNRQQNRRKPRVNGGSGNSGDGGAPGGPPSSRRPGAGAVAHPAKPHPADGGSVGASVSLAAINVAAETPHHVHPETRVLTSLGDFARWLHVSGYMDDGEPLWNVDLLPLLDDYAREISASVPHHNAVSRLLRDADFHRDTIRFVRSDGREGKAVRWAPPLCVEPVAFLAEAERHAA